MTDCELEIIYPVKKWEMGVGEGEERSVMLILLKLLSSAKIFTTKLIFAFCASKHNKLRKQFCGKQFSISSSKQTFFTPFRRSKSLNDKK